jgi:hypothetical protein
MRLLAVDAKSNRGGRTAGRVAVGRVLKENPSVDGAGATSSETENTYRLLHRIDWSFDHGNPLSFCVSRKLPYATAHENSRRENFSSDASQQHLAVADHHES